MGYRTLVGAATFTAMVLASIAGARSDDVSTYPDWRGEWVRAVGVQWDPSRPPARGQQAPLTAEYQKEFEAALAQQVVGGQECVAPYRLVRLVALTAPWLRRLIWFLAGRSLCRIARDRASVPRDAG